MKHAPWVLIAVLLSLLVFGRCGMSAREAEARIYRAQADSLRAVNATLAKQTETQAAELVARDSAHAVDSARWRAERTENRAEAAEARRTGEVAAEALRVRLDTIGARILAEYEASMDVERAAWAATEAAYAAEAESQRARIAQRDELIATLFERVDVLEAESALLREAERLVRAELAAQRRTGWAWKGVAVLEGVGLAYVAVTR